MPRPRPAPAAAALDPDDGRVRAALVRALAEADRGEELPEAAEALRRGGFEGLVRDQGPTIANKFAELLRMSRAEAGAS